MANPGQFGVREHLWDKGWALRNLRELVMHAQLVTTAIDGGIWVVTPTNVSTNLYVEEILVASDTTVRVSVAFTFADPGGATFGAQPRNTYGHSAGAACEAFIGPLPGYLTNLFTAWAPANQNARLLKGRWLAPSQFNYLVVTTEPLAATIDVSIFMRGF